MSMQFSLLEKLVGLQPSASGLSSLSEFSLLEKLVGLQLGSCMRSTANNLVYSKNWSVCNVMPVNMKGFTI